MLVSIKSRAIDTITKLELPAADRAIKVRHGQEAAQALKCATLCSRRTSATKSIPRLQRSVASPPLLFAAFARRSEHPAQPSAPFPATPRARLFSPRISRFGFCWLRASLAQQVRQRGGLFSQLGLARRLAASRSAMRTLRASSMAARSALRFCDLGSAAAAAEFSNIAFFAAGGGALAFLKVQGI